MTLMLLDAIKVVNQEARKGLSDSSHVRDLVTRTIPLRWGETTDSRPRHPAHDAQRRPHLGLLHLPLPSRRGRPQPGVLRGHQVRAELVVQPRHEPVPRLETLVLESTYGGYRDIQPSRQQATDDFSALTTRIVSRGGKLIVPVFAVGRSQEVMLVLEERMREGKIPKVPVYLDGMIFEATAIHTAYPEFLNSQLRTQIFQQGDNPFLSDIFHRVDSQQMRMSLLDSKEPCIILATSGMMSGGPVMEYFRAWATDEKNGLLFVGYQAEGTFGRRLQRGLSEATFLDGPRQVNVPVRIDIATIEGFSGHSDRVQLMNYVASLDPRPQRIILNHGEESKIINLPGACTSASTWIRGPRHRPRGRPGPLRSGPRRAPSLSWDEGLNRDPPVNRPAYSRDNHMAPSARRFLILGLDGATFDLLDPLMEAGDLPFLRTLAGQGVKAPLTSVYPAKTIPAWYSFATGLDPGELGIFGFTEPDGAPGQSRLVHSFRPSEAIWDRLSRLGRRVGVVNFPLHTGYPVHGFILPGMFSATSPTFPSGLRAEVEGEIGGAYPSELPVFKEAERDAWVAEATRSIEQRGRAAAALAARHHPDFLFALFRETDRVQHQLWSELDRPVDQIPADLRAFFRSVDTACAAIDRAFRASGGPAVTFVISDHGHGKIESDFLTNRWLIEEGFLVFKNAPDTWSRRLFAKVLPRVQHWPLVQRVSPRIAGFLSKGRGAHLANRLLGDASFERATQQNRLGTDGGVPPTPSPRGSM